MNWSRKALPEAWASAMWKSRFAAKVRGTSGIARRWASTAFRIRARPSVCSVCAASRAAPGSTTRRAS
jgi:hypothetical protein